MALFADFSEALICLPALMPHARVWLPRDTQRGLPENPMPFVNAQVMNCVLYPIHLPVAYETDSRNRAGQGRTLTLGSRIARFSTDHESAGGSKDPDGTHVARVPGRRDQRQPLGWHSSSDPRVVKSRSASRQTNSVLGAGPCDSEKTFPTNPPTIAPRRDPKRGERGRASRRA